MNVIAIANQKGGVGKTTTAVNLSAALVKLKRRVLLVDLDAQGTATCHMMGKYGADGRCVYDALLRQVPLAQIIVKTPCGVQLAPNNLSMATLDSDIINEYRREERLRMALEEVADGFDYAVIDCPPQLATTTINAFTACDVVLIPIECKPEAWEAVPRLLHTLRRIIDEFRHPLRIYGLPTFLDRTIIARDTYALIGEKFESLALSPIHRNVRLAEAFAARSPITLFDPAASGAVDYHRAAKEIIEYEEKPGRRAQVERESSSA